MNVKSNFGPALRLGVISLIICGFLFPVIVTGFGQILMPYQANGDILQFHGRPVGSYLIAQNFTSPLFFHPRNDSASGVDPDITLQDAYSQIERIATASGISSNAIKQLVDSNVEKTFWFFGDSYVNTLNLNLQLINSYPVPYHAYV